jgi:site-specific DNA-adenine methylase
MDMMNAYAQGQYNVPYNAPTRPSSNAQSMINETAATTSSTATNNQGQYSMPVGVYANSQAMGTNSIPGIYPLASATNSNSMTTGCTYNLPPVITPQSAISYQNYYYNH